MGWLRQREHLSDMLSTPERPAWHLYSVNERFFDNPLTWTEDVSYWFGWLVTDGSNASNGANISIRIAESDRPQLERLKQLISYTGPITTLKRTQRVEYIKGVRLTGPQQDRAVLAIASRSLSSTVRALGVQAGKGGSFTAPAINPATYHHFVRGLFEGNGCFSFSKWNKWESNLTAAPQLLGQIQSWLTSNRILSHVDNVWGTPFGNGAQVLRICGNNTGMKVFRLLYSDCHHLLPRKLEAFVKLYQYKKTRQLKPSEKEPFCLFETAILPYASPYPATN